MSACLGASGSHALAMRGGALAAATVFAGAGLAGAATVGPDLPSSPLAVVHHDYVLTVDPAPMVTDFATSLQNLLNAWDLGTLDEVLAGFGTVPNSSPEVDFSVSSTVAQLLTRLNPDGLTLGQIFGQLGIPLGIPLYSDNGPSLLGSDTFTIGSLTIDNPFVFTAPASFYTTNWGEPHAGDYLYSSINGTPLGDVELGKLVDLLLGGAGQGDLHTLPELIDKFGFDLNQDLPSLGGLTGIFGWLSGLTTYEDALAKLAGMLSNFNVEENSCSGIGLATVCNSNYVHPELSLTNSSLNDWLSGLLQTSTTDVTHITNSYSGGLFGHIVTAQTTLPGTTLGDYLQTVPWGTAANTFLGDQSLGTLLGMNPDDTWNEYLSSLVFGGIFFHPGTDPLGDQTIGDVLLSWLPADSGLTEIDGDTPITEILGAFGLFG